MGTYPAEVLRRPFIPTSDGAGIIGEVGPNVTGWKKGDRVMSMFTQLHLKGVVPTIKEQPSVLAGDLDGMLTQWKVVSGGSKTRVGFFQDSF